MRFNSDYDDDYTIQSLSLSQIIPSVVFPMVLFSAHRSDNFIVGLTNVSVTVSRPTMWKYTICGQYPGAVPSRATVSLYCPDNLPPARYVIVQLPRTGYMNFCELKVLVKGRPTLFKATEWCTHGSCVCNIWYCVLSICARFSSVDIIAKAWNFWRHCYSNLNTQLKKTAGL